jgi:hypothetical protein
MALPTTRTVPAEQPLYDKDQYSWALEQAQALRERRAEHLDWNNLAEEVEDLARRNADALRSHFESLIEHLLKRSMPRRLRNVTTLGFGSSVSEIPGAGFVICSKIISVLRAAAPNYSRRHGPTRATRR